jgi:perosamine synthetase
MIPTYRPSLGAEELEAIARVFARGHLGLGKLTGIFERQLALFLGVPHVVCVDHGTSALHLALEATGLSPGDEVLVPSLTFVATVQAIRMTGAIPAFCEVCPETLNLDLEDALRRMTPRTRVILPVHFGGLPCDLGRLLEAASNRGLKVVADAAHAFGARWQGKPIAALGDFACFSFDAIKNITCGEGGAITTSDAAVARRLRRRRRLGIDTDGFGAELSQRSWQYRVVEHGYRCHMSDMNAALGIEQLKKFAEFQRRKRQIVASYDAAFTGLRGMRPLEHDLVHTCPWAYVVRVGEGRRDEFREFLRKRGVGTLIQFIPNHLQEAFAAFRVALPVTEQLFKEIVSLPLFAGMTDAEVHTVQDAVRAFPWFHRKGHGRRTPLMEGAK